MTSDLFPDLNAPNQGLNILGEAVLLRGYAVSKTKEIVRLVTEVAERSPFRRMQTPGGYWMSVETTSCGKLGWTADRHGYRYSLTDPTTGYPWPGMPNTFAVLAEEAAAEAGFSRFRPDSCLINRYSVGTKLSLHQDKDESEMCHPIVSVSLGIPATFLFGGKRRSDAVQRVLLESGDVVVWGGAKRMHYHGIAQLKANRHPLLGELRLNLTFRKAR